ncbi:MAG TPA: LamG domain-containing protein, partial [Verrucomicrobiae bacterium]|nr:LamG domain-containing protein [Verrucomicrobiae bacterium]
LNGDNQFVSLPSGLAGMKTFMAWVKWNGGPAWQRIYDFGNDTNRYTVLTPYNSDTGTFRFNISIDSRPGEQIVDAPAALPVNVWTHVAVVLNGAEVVLYTNGVPVGANLFANLLPTDLNATNFYFGKSQWPADPYFNGELSAVRIFSTPLTSNQIVSPQITISQPAQGATYQPGATINLAGSARDFYDVSIANNSLTWTVSYVDAGNTNVVYGPVHGSSGSFAIPASGAQATNGFYQVQLSAADLAGRAATNTVNVYPLAATPSSTWASFYPFTSGAQDASNNFNGTFQNGASIVNDPQRGNVLNLAPITGQYVSFPAGAGNAQTVSGWVKWEGGNAWQRIFDFGQNTSSFFFLTAADNTGYPQCAITADLAVYNQVIESPVALPVNQWVPFAVVMNGKEGILYLNGVAVAVNNSLNLLPSDLASTNVNLGKSEFSTDPYFNGRLSDVRLNSAPVPLAQMLAPLPAIVEPDGLSLFAGGSPLDFFGAATDYTGAPLSNNAFSWSGDLFSNGVVYAAFGPLAGITNGAYVVPNNAATITNIAYRIYLTVTDSNGYQQSVSADVLPQVSQLSLVTVPSLLPLSLDGQSLATPASITAVVGMTRQISAPSPQLYSGANLSFVLWSDGGAATHNILVPPTKSVFTASYFRPGIGITPNGAGRVTLSWPQWASTLALYSATSLAPPVSWSPANGTPVNSNGWITLSVALTNATCFYRLQSP